MRCVRCAYCAEVMGDADARRLAALVEGHFATVCQRPLAIARVPDTVA